MTNVLVMAEENYRFLGMSVYEWVISFLTFGILLATGTYAFYTIRLWKETKKSVDSMRLSTEIVRLEAFMNCMLSLVRQVRESQLDDPAIQKNMEVFVATIVELALGGYIERNINDPAIIESLKCVAEGMQKAGIEPSNIPILRILFSGRIKAALERKKS